jgi:hypothetical protein
MRNHASRSARSHEAPKIFLLIARIADFLTLVEETHFECADELVNLFCNN